MSALTARRQQFAAPRARSELIGSDETVAVSKVGRAALKGQRPACLWMTGLSGAGKSTIASAVERQLHHLGYHTYIIDGDKMRGGLCADLGFTEDDRIEQNRRVAETARMLVDAGLIVLVAVISPFEKERHKARNSFAPGEFFEVYVSTPLATCEERDTKGLYRRARENKLPNFTGISSPYEPPAAPDLTLNCGGEPVAESAEHMMLALRRFGIIA